MLSIHEIIYCFISLITILATLPGSSNAMDACSQVASQQKELSNCMYQCDPSFEADVMRFYECSPFEGQWSDECRLIIKKKGMVVPCFCGCMEEFEPDYLKIQECSGSKYAEDKRWEFCEMKCMCRGKDEKIGEDGRWPAIEICPSFCDTEAEGRKSKSSRDEL